MNEKIKEISDYLMKKDPENFKDYYNYTEDLGAIIGYYYFEKLKWCGCGRPGDAMRTVAKFLKTISDRDAYFETGFKETFGTEMIYDNELLICLAYSLDAAGFTEHGTSIYSAWPTQDGEYFLYAIEEAEKNDELDI